MVVISPVVVLIVWGCWLIVILGRDIIGLAVIMAGTALLLAFYSIMLWWRSQWQSSSMYSVDLSIVKKIDFFFRLGKSYSDLLILFSWQSNFLLIFGYKAEYVKGCRI